jgi:hypothetical protein
MGARKTLVTGFLATAALLALASEAEARPTIKNPNDHPEYRAELEPHLNTILWHGSYHSRYGKYRGFGDPEFGGGFRATIEIADPAFIPKINNTVGITFGIDFTNCRYCRRDGFSVWTPVGVQWNFFFTDKFSAFADLGFMLRSGGFYRDIDPDFFVMVGGRYHFNDKVALTFRLGQPFVSLGVSFFVGS